MAQEFAKHFQGKNLGCRGNSGLADFHGEMTEHFHLAPSTFPSEFD